MAATPTPSATPTQSPTATATAPPKVTPQPEAAGVTVSETSLTLPTYPFKDYLVEQIDPVYNIPVYYFNRAEYESANPTPTPVEYRAVVLENEYLRLTFLPQLGGRLYSAVIKTTGQEVFYHNPVVKPSRYGGLQPAEANWWLATGGMEWAYPTYEHGYRFGVPWEYRIAQTAGSATITLSDTAANRVGLEVAVTLPAESAAFTVAPKLVNNSPNSTPIQLWTNAALTLTSGSMSPDTRFVAPTQVITIHSRGESGWSVPGEREPAPWPQVGETDLSDYRQWANYLGFFVPNQAAPFVGAYNAATRLGIVRLAPAEANSGSSKVFAFGVDFPDRSYTDDESQYFEIWGGANAGFWPEYDIVLPAGDTLGWQEQWWPLAGLNGLTWATANAAIHLEQRGNVQLLSALVSRPVQGQIEVMAAGEPILDENFSAGPDKPLTWEFAAGRPLQIILTGRNGVSLLEYKTG